MFGSKKSLVLALACFAAVFSHAQDLTLPATSTTTVQTRDSNENIFKGGKWALDLGGGASSEGKDEGAFAYSFFFTEFQFQFTPWLTAKVAPYGRLYSARSQERADDDSYATRIGLSDAYLAYVPYDAIELRGGTFRQKFLGAPMVISNYRSFPGLQQIGRLEFQGVNAELTLQQLIPTSHSLNVDRIEQEKLPMFQTQSVGLKGRAMDALDWEVKGGLYQWSNIPSKVAYESMKKGNEPTGNELPTNTKYRFGHQGWFGGFDLCYCTGEMFGFVVEYQRAQNLKAPSNSADGQLWGLGPKINWGDYELDVRYRSYFIESDLTVAAYGRSRFGYTNRIGENLEAKLNFKKNKFAIYAELFRADPINPRNTQQRDMTEFYIGVETDYASF